MAGKMRVDSEIGLVFEMKPEDLGFKSQLKIEMNEDNNKDVLVKLDADILDQTLKYNPEQR